MIIDRKFNISATHTTKGTYHSERSSVLFLAKDLALVPTLEFYRSECERQGAEQRQITGITLLIGRVKQYQEMNPAVCRVADIDPGLEEIKVNAPNEV